MTLDHLATLARFISLAGILLVIGEAVCSTLLSRRLDPNDPVRVAVGERIGRLRRWSLAVLAVALGGRLVLQAKGFTDPGENVLPMVTTVLTAMTWGHGWIAQAIALLGCALPVKGVVRTVFVVALGATPAFMGHAIASERAATLAVITDGLHVLSSGAWLGTLTVLVVSVLPVTSPKQSLQLIRTFSPVALTAAAIVAVTGSVSALLHLSSWGDLLSDVYGQLLFFKVVVVGVAGLLGGYNWKRSTPQLERGDPSALRRVSRLEVAAAVAVLLVTSVLIATPFPGEG